MEVLVGQGQHEVLPLEVAAAAAVGQEQHAVLPLEAAAVGQEQHAVLLEAAAVRQEQPHELVRQLQFPPGYHFVPNEEELVDVYLRAKIEGWEPPLHVVNEVNILDWQPGSLVEAYKGYGEHKWYFFTVRELSTSNKEEEPNRKVRAPGVKATWKATGSVVPITAKGRQEGGGEAEEPAAAATAEKVVLGTKRVLIYHSNDPEEDGKWSMHEYILAGHGKIGQYVLCSIQRKQHSDTVDNAGEGSSRIISRRKRTNASSVDPRKTKKRRTNKNKAASTQPEGVQLQQQEAPIEALPVAPLQGYPSHPDGMLGASAPTHDEDTGAHQDISQSIECLKILLRSGDQQKQQLQGDVDYNSFAVHDQNLYTEEQYFPGSITQNHSSWEHGQHQMHEIGGPFGAPDQHIGGAFGAPDHHTNAQYYDPSSYEHMYEFLLTDCDLSNQFITEIVQKETVSSGNDGDMGLAGGGGFDPMSLLCYYDPQDCVGTEDESSRQALHSNPEAAQRNQDEHAQRNQDEHAANGDVCDEQPPLNVSLISGNADAVRGGHFYGPWKV